MDHLHIYSCPDLTYASMILIHSLPSELLQVCVGKQLCVCVQYLYLVAAFWAVFLPLTGLMTNNQEQPCFEDTHKADPKGLYV